MKTLLKIAGIAALVALLALSLLLMVAGYRLWGVIALLAAGALVYAAARFWANTPEPPAADDREWLVWDTELDAELSDTERRMARDGWVRVMPSDPVDWHAAQWGAALNEPPDFLPARRSGGM